MATKKITELNQLAGADIDQNSDVLAIVDLNNNETKKVTVGALHSGSFSGSYIGDGSGLTGIDAGFSPDAQGNLVAGTNAGEDLDGSSGVCNVFIGQEAGRNITSGEHNTLLGSMAGCALIDEDQNIMIGKCTGRFAKSSDNIFLGTYAGSNAGCGGSGGDYNIALGDKAMRLVNSGNVNIAIGCEAGCGLTSGGCNIFIGKQSGCKSTTGTFNIAIGEGAVSNCNLTGGNNIALGRNAGYFISGGGCNLFLGLQAGKYANSNHGIALGREALAASWGGAASSGNDNIAIGCQAAYTTTSGNTNITIGKSAGRCITTGYQNIYLGHTAGLGYSSGATGNNNIALGQAAGYTLCCAQESVFIGTKAGYYNKIGKRNVYIGCGAGRCMGQSGGADNVALGHCALAGSTTPGSNTGGSNVSIGEGSGFAITSGNYNVFLGRESGCTVTSRQRNILIGTQVQAVSATGNCQLAIGNATDRWITGDNSFNVCLAGSTIKAMNSGGVFCATKFCGDGSCLTGITASGTGAIGGLTVKDEGSVVGTAGSISCFDFVGSAVAVTATTGAAGIATVTITGGGVFKCIATKNFVTDNTCSGCNFATSGVVPQHNFIVGQCAGQAMTCGKHNFFVGYYAGRNVTTGRYNMAFGAFAYSDCNATGCSNIIMGKYAGCCTNTASNNVYIGDYVASRQLNNGGNNVAIGNKAGEKLSFGEFNVLIGCQAGGGLAGGDGNIFIGKHDDCNTTIGGNNNIALGCMAGNNLSNGSSNIFLGGHSGGSNTSGDYNIAIGCSVCLPIADGDKQLAIGCGTNRWIAGDSSYNVTIAGIATITATGIVSATKFCGDGSCLTGISGGGSSGCLKIVQTSSLVSDGMCAGCCLASGSCHNIFLGCCAAH